MILMIDNYDSFTYHLVQYCGEWAWLSSQIQALYRPGASLPSGLRAGRFS